MLARRVIPCLDVHDGRVTRGVSFGRAGRELNPTVLDALRAEARRASTTLLAGVLSGIHVNPYIVDALIGFSVVYKAFDNLDGFQTLFGFQPNTKAAVLGFGLIHGFGLATKLQEFALSTKGLIANMISFNVGVEIGQLIALSIILLIMVPYRQTSVFMKQAVFANVLLMTAGFILAGYQIAGYILGPIA